MWNEIVDTSSDVIVQSILFLTNNITHNHGWSIIVLTLIFRVLIFPLTLKSMKSMKAMQALQPKIKEMQAKYKDDKERQAREQMKLFKEHGVNPMGGCLPLLLQLPIFILLFRVLRSPELNGFILVNSSFYGLDLTTAAITRLPQTYLGGLALTMPGMMDLSTLGIGFLHNTYLYLPSLILVAFMVVTTFVQQAQMVVDPQQKTTMYMMNLMIVYFSVMMPTGVLLYWGLSNAFQIVQQKFTGGPTIPDTKAKKSGKKDEAKDPPKKDTRGFIQKKLEEAQKVMEDQAAAGKKSSGDSQKTTEKDKGAAASPPSPKRNTPPAKPQSSKRKKKKKKR